MDCASSHGSTDSEILQHQATFHARHRSLKGGWTDDEVKAGSFEVFSSPLIWARVSIVSKRRRRLVAAILAT